MSKDLLDKKDIERAITRMAHEIIEKNKGIKSICLVGIQRGGVHIANRLSSKLKEIEGNDLPVGALDIALYRDDLNVRKDQPVVRRTQVPCEISGKKVVLVDDVFYRGRTTRAALDALNDYGRPSKVQLAVLVDRGGRELPIEPDFCGKKVTITSGEEILVHVSEIDGVDEVVVR